MLEKTCAEFIDVLASEAPVPGGGGASALVASVGTALGSMVGNLTKGKKKYADVEDDILDLLERSKSLMEEFNDLVAEDAEVFEPLSKAYGLPKETEEEKEKKEAVLQAALVDATRVPLEIMEKCLEAIKVLDEYSQKGSRLVLSDAGVGAIFCKSAMQGAKLNVLINLKLMKNENLRKGYQKRMEAAESEGLLLADKVYGYVEEQLY